VSDFPGPTSGESGGVDSSTAGLRPAGFFLGISAVLIAVIVRSAQLAFVEAGEQPNAMDTNEAPWPEFEIVDRTGRSLALSVECFDVTVSPRALWRAHTPERLARILASALEVEDASLLLARLLPPEVEAGAGWLAPAAPELLSFDVAGARALRNWIEGGVIEEGRKPMLPLEGFRLKPLPDERWTLAWSPAVVLSSEERTHQIGEELGKRPERWTRRWLGDLASLVRAAGLPDDVQEDLDRKLASQRTAHLSDLIWNELCPSTYRLVARRVDPVRAHTLAKALEAEYVSPWQIQLVPRLERHHPVRPLDVGVQAIGAGDANGSDPFSVLGHWGVLGEEDALRQAGKDLETSPHLLSWEGDADPLDARADELGRRWRPWSGLEKLCADILEVARHELPLEESARSYLKRKRNVSRDRRSRWPDKRVPDYFGQVQVGGAVPRFESTLDATLQRGLHEELLSVHARFDPALVMGIAVDVETGDVLAVDAVQAYGSRSFAPTQHAFTPGSTFKAVVMATALDQGVVRPDELFETFFPAGIVVRDERGRGRRVKEAEGAPDAPWVTATQGLARSVNAVLVQIGLRVKASEMRSTLVDLGYGARPGVGLGPERSGYLPPLVKGTWPYRLTHTSVCFGHELSVTLWQHASALATIARRGERLPLRLIEGLSQGAASWELSRAEGQRVLSERACDQVLSMMAVGAESGTGRHVANAAMQPEFFYVGTKTGTTEKVSTEKCIHAELAHSLDHQTRETSCSKVCYASLAGVRHHKGRNSRPCYTSSMAAIGQLTPGGSKVLVLVVVEDPRSKERFGSDVAGRATMRILRRSFGLEPEHGGLIADRARPLPAGAFSSSQIPWWEPR
jgi:cell division protein FtsI/penicillin-binding protein 2